MLMESVLLLSVCVPSSFHRAVSTIYLWREKYLIARLESNFVNPSYATALTIFLRGRGGRQEKGQYHDDNANK